MINLHIKAHLGSYYSLKIVGVIPITRHSVYKRLVARLNAHRAMRMTVNDRLRDNARTDTACGVVFPVSCLPRMM